MNVVDLFAGAGGFTTGALQAGASVLWAANHWPDAVRVHEANHPGVDHACQDLHQADWRAVPRHDVLLASPACQGHSRARGTERPHHDAQRSTAWAVVSALEFHRTPVAVVENVPEFQRWALYPAWCQALCALGYSLSPHLLDAADHGVPQHRMRLMLVLTRSRAPLQLVLRRRRHVPASKFLRFGHGTWSQIRATGRAPATISRWKAGRAAHGSRFLMPYYGSGSGLTGRSIHRPIGTITTVDRWAIVDGDRMRMLAVDEARAAMGFPANYILPSSPRAAMCMLGNSVPPPMARDVLVALSRAA